MVLPRTRSVHTFGMRFPIDVAFCDRDLVVLGVARVPPLADDRCPGGVPAVIEAEAGAFERWGLRVGDRLELADDGSTRLGRRRGRRRSGRRTADDELPATGPGPWWWWAPPSATSGDLSPRAVAALAVGRRHLLRGHPSLAQAAHPRRHHRGAAAVPPRAQRGRPDRRGGAAVAGGADGRRWSATPACPACPTRAPGWWPRWPRPGSTVTVVPGPSAVLAALVAAGCPPTASASRGSCPVRAGAHRTARPRWPPRPGPRCSSRRRVGWPPPWPTWPRCAGRPAGGRGPGADQAPRGGLAGHAGRRRLRGPADGVRGEVVLVLGGAPEPGSRGGRRRRCWPRPWPTGWPRGPAPGGWSTRWRPLRGAPPPGLRAGPAPCGVDGRCRAGDVRRGRRCVPGSGRCNGARRVRR